MNKDKKIVQHEYHHITDDPDKWYDMNFDGFFAEFIQVPKPPDADKIIDKPF